MSKQPKGKQTTEKQSEIIKKYTALAKHNSKYPGRAELKGVGISRDMIRHHFGDMQSLKTAAIELNPLSFEEIIDFDFFNKELFEKQVREVKSHKVFVIQSVVAGGFVHENLLDSVKTFLKKKNGMHLIVPADYALQSIDPDLLSDEDIHIVFQTLHLNSNICVNPIKIDPKQIDPTTSLDSFGHTETCVIGSPKQTRISVANSNNKLARLIQATGALTKPRYIPKDGIEKRRDTLAKRHHKMGGVIVEITNNKRYHIRHFEMCKDGSFNDLFYNYSPDGIKYIGCEAVIQGDKHVGDTDPEVNAAVDEMCKIGKPNYRIEHDFFNGKSINPHGIDDIVEAVQLNEAGLSNLKEELQLCANELTRMRKLKTAKAIVIVESNHNEWIMRYLKKGKFSPENHIFATKLQLAVMEHRKPPFKTAMEMLGVKMGADLIFLEIDDDFIKAGCALGNHGHLGANGKKNPGIKGMYRTYGKCLFGHVHHGGIWHDAISVGTSTYRRLGYNRGGSSWDNSAGILYKDGTRQLVNIIFGEWR